MEIKLASELEGDILEKISEVCVDAFYDSLKKFTKDKTKLVKCLSHMLKPEYINVAIIDNEIAGIIVCINKGQSCLNLDKKTMIKYFGKMKGTIAGIFGIRKYNNKYLKFPIPINEETGIIEFLATNVKYRKRGVATSLMKHIFTLYKFKHHVLEVEGHNINAIELYKKFGFKEQHRWKLPFIGRKFNGVEYVVYMEHIKE
jgi:ribosomal protein S18 acetylase RimI-like enzyme